MAFVQNNLSSLAYGNGFTLWHYRSAADGAAVIAASGYFNAAANMMRVGDYIILDDSGSRFSVIHVTSNNGATVETSVPDVLPPSSFLTVDDTARRALGEVQFDSSGRAYMYVEAGSGGLAATHVSKIPPLTFAAVKASNSAAATSVGFPVGVGRSTVAAGKFGWVQIYGKVTVAVAANDALGTLQLTTGTAGVIDDATGGGTVPIHGLALLETVTDAGPAEVFLNFPYFGVAN